MSKKAKGECEYRFVVVGGITLLVDVFATSLEDAVQKAQRASVQSLCYQCARGDEGEWSTSGEIDCDPSMCELVEVSVDGEVDEGELAQAKERWG